MFPCPDFSATFVGTLHCLINYVKHSHSPLILQQKYFFGQKYTIQYSSDFFLVSQPWEFVLLTSPSVLYSIEYRYTLALCLMPCQPVYQASANVDTSPHRDQRPLNIWSLLMFSFAALMYVKVSSLVLLIIHLVTGHEEKGFFMLPWTSMTFLGGIREMVASMFSLIQVHGMKAARWCSG